MIIYACLTHISKYRIFCIRKSNYLLQLDNLILSYNISQ